MGKQRIQVGEEADEERPHESMIERSYNNFAALVIKSYSPRFTKPVKATEVLTPEQEPTSRISGKTRHVSRRKPTGAAT